jgi:hypothetical protein
MSVYDYIARNNPNLAESIINSFGYEVIDRQDLGKSLKELVANVGEPALAKIMKNHPDRDILMELNPQKPINIAKTEAPITEVQRGNCGCNSCKNREGNYLNANGINDTTAKEQMSASSMAHQTNIILIVSALFIATAVIMNKR